MKRAATALLGLTIMSCAPERWDPNKLARGESNTLDEQIARGQDSYQTYCAGCHGAQGDGEGPAARFLGPKPRDFRKARIKFASVAAGQMPRDEDLLRVITHGLSGTSMPSWSLLPQQERLDIIAYLKTFSDAWKGAPGAPVPIPPDPYRKKPETGVEEGERIYHGMAQCSSCHPAYVSKAKLADHMKSTGVPFSGSFRDRLYESVEKDSEWGAPIRPPDFLVDRVKAGSTKEELVMVIAAGVGGTAMPSWASGLSPRELWGIAYYVESLVAMRGTPEAAQLKRDLTNQPQDAK